MKRQRYEQLGEPFLDGFPYGHELGKQPWTCPKDVLFKPSGQHDRRMSRL